MMKIQTLSCAAVLAANLMAAPMASAETRAREEVVNAAGSCVPFAPTAQLRNSVGGVRNAGTQTFYAVCSQQAVFSFNTTGTSAVAIYVNNSGPSNITINCTLRPGYSVTGNTTIGGAYPKSVLVEPGELNVMSWNAETLGEPGDRFLNPNYTCSVPVNGSISFLYNIFDEDVGA